MSSTQFAWFRSLSAKDAHNLMIKRNTKIRMMMALEDVRQGKTYEEAAEANGVKPYSIHYWLQKTTQDIGFK